MAKQSVGYAEGYNDGMAEACKVVIEILSINSLPLERIKAEVGRWARDKMKKVERSY